MHILNFFCVITSGPRRARFPHSPYIYHACSSLFIESNTQNNRQPLGIRGYRRIYLTLGTRKKCDEYTRMLQINAPFVWKHGGSRVKLSLLPFCGWIPRPTKAIWTRFERKRTQSVQYFGGSIGWLDTHKKHTNKR